MTEPLTSTYPDTRPRDDIPITGAPEFYLNGTEALVPIVGTAFVLVQHKKTKDLRSEK